MVRVDLTNKVFGKLLVISKYDVVGNGETRWLCHCDCGNDIIVRGSNLKKMNTQSCGCLHKEMTSKAKRKYNKYDLTNEYGIGWTTNTDKNFYFDLVDYDKIKDFTWLENDQNYIISSQKNEHNSSYRLHRVILDINDSNIIIDHKNTNKNDNRRNNLRLANKSTNGINRGINSNNTSGYKGIAQIGNQYIARIMYNYKNINIGSFDTIEKAIKARKDKEIELFGEFNYKGDDSIER